MGDKNGGHYTIGDALVIIIFALFATPIGWIILLIIALGLLSRP